MQKQMESPSLHYRPLRKPRSTVSLIALLLILAAPDPASAQIPEQFTNLQVLPENIPQGDLIGIMRSFTFATGIRCSGCHVGEESQPLSEYDFAADDMLAKRTARGMLRMVQSINGQHLASLEERSSPDVNVTCATCHGGIRRPVPIADVVTQTVASDGADAAIDSYRQLRDRYLGSRAFDFRERPLLQVAEELARADDAPSALAILDLSLTLFPNSTLGYSTKGQIHMDQGETEAAIAAFERALELNPDNRLAESRLAELRGG